MNSLQISEPQSIEQQLIDFLSIERLLKPEVSYVIQAGYFERTPDYFSFASLRSGLALKAAVETQTRIAPKIYTLRNDIGPGCDSSCHLTESAGEESPFAAAWEIPIVRQKTALNRGLRRLRKLLKSDPDRFNVVNNGSESIVTFLDRQRTPVKLAIVRGDQLIGLCPLILASFYEMILSEEDPSAVLVDYCHYVEVQKVATAVEVLNGVFFRDERKAHTVIAAALDSEGKNLSPILI